VRSAACTGFNGDGGFVQAYGDSCLGHSATYAACSGLSLPDAAAAGACAACLATPDSPDASQEGVVVEGTLPVVNYFGCIQAVDPTEAGVSCAHTVEIAVECIDYACRTACRPITDDLSWVEYMACTDEATRGACLGYALSAEQCISVEEGDGGTPVATICFGGGTAGTAEDHYLSSARYFCGG
jgi:hypothetical protein